MYSLKQFHLVACSAAALIGVVASCASLLTIPVQTSASSTVEGNPLGGLLAILPFDDLANFDIMESEALENQGVAPEDLQSVVLTAFTLTVESPEGQDLSFIDSLAFYVEADGLEKVRIAHSEDFPGGVPSVALVLDEVELVEYVVADTMEITTEASATVPAETTTLRADVSFDVTATVTGACHAIKEQTGTSKL